MAKKRGRPRKTAETRHFWIHLSLTVGEDDDLIAYLEGVPKGKRAAGILALCQGSSVLTSEIVDEEEDLFAELENLLR